MVTLGIIINETRLTTVLCAYTSFPTDFFYMYDINTKYFNLQHHIHLQKTWVCNYENMQQTLKAKYSNSSDCIDLLRSTKF